MQDKQYAAYSTAKKLEPGDSVTIGDSQYTAKLGADGKKRYNYESNINDPDSNVSRHNISADKAEQEIAQKVASTNYKISVSHKETTGSFSNWEDKSPFGDAKFVNKWQPKHEEIGGNGDKVMSEMFQRNNIIGKAREAGGNGGIDAHGNLWTTSKDGTMTTYKLNNNFEYEPSGYFTYRPTKR